MVYTLFLYGHLKRITCCYELAVPRTNITGKNMLNILEETWILKASA